MKEIEDKIRELGNMTPQSIEEYNEINAQINLLNAAANVLESSGEHQAG